MLNKATIWNCTYLVTQVSHVGEHIVSASYSDIGYTDNIFNTHGMPFSYITDEVCSSIERINSIGSLNSVKNQNLKRSILVGQIGNE